MGMNYKHLSCEERTMIQLSLSRAAGNCAQPASGRRVRSIAGYNETAGPTRQRVAWSAAVRRWLSRSACATERYSGSADGKIPRHARIY